jgi:hypothetical protein
VGRYYSSFYGAQLVIAPALYGAQLIITPALYGAQWVVITPTLYGAQLMITPALCGAQWVVITPALYAAQCTAYLDKPFLQFFISPCFEKYFIRMRWGHFIVCICVSLIITPK